jgi:hypothetical protein
MLPFYRQESHHFKDFFYVDFVTEFLAYWGLEIGVARRLGWNGNEKERNPPQF